MLTGLRIASWALSCAAVLATAAAAAQQTDVDVAGVGRSTCAALNARPQPEGELATVTAATNVSGRYQNWLFGWFSGMNVARSDGGLGALGLDDAVIWYFSVQAICHQDPEQRYADAVRGLARDVFGSGSASGGGRPVAGFGLSRCSEMLARIADPSLGDTVSHYNSWMYGFQTGYNALRTDVGLEPLDVSDEAAAWDWAKQHCVDNPTNYFNATVSLWTMDLESRQKATPVPSNAKFTETAEQAFSRARQVAAAAKEVATGPVALEGVGSWTCDQFIKLHTDEDVPFVLQADSLGWIAGYLTTSDAVHAAQGRVRVDWSAVKPEILVERTLQQCQKGLRDGVASAVIDVEAELTELAPSRAPREDGATVIGFGALGCAQLNSSSDATLDEPRRFVQEAYTRVFLMQGVTGWIEGFFSGTNAFMITPAGAPLWDLANVGERGREFVTSYCSQNADHDVYLAVIEFAQLRFGER